MTNHALVVDDSKLARIVLRNMLTERGITVDTAESAEEALGYLCNFRPDVIFMDHIMPGMDGLQAVKAIKEDPATATIPILMYTSKEGEVYMSQARALGAVGVLPKQLKPVDLELVLSRLKLLPGQKYVSPTNDGYADKANAIGIDDEENLEVLAQKAHDTTIGISIRNTVKKMLASNNLRMRKEFRLVALEIAETLGKNQKSNGMWIWFAAFFGILLMQTAWFSYENQQLAAVIRSTAQELDQIKNAGIETEQVTRRVAMTSQASAIQHSLVPKLPDWLMDQDDSVQFGDIPFGNEQLHTLSRLVAHLENQQFKGTVRLISHVGEFCLKMDEQNNVILPSEDSDITECEVNAYGRYEAQQLGLQQSDSFTQFVDEYQAANPSCIDIELITEGKGNPLYVYPDYYQIKTAQEWNQVAGLNNRVEYELLPAGLSR
jgi:CheY-like chemotaxis protein